MGRAYGTRRVPACSLLFSLSLFHFLFFLIKSSSSFSFYKYRILVFCGIFPFTLQLGTWYLEMVGVLIIRLSCGPCLFNIFILFYISHMLFFWQMRGKCLGIRYRLMFMAPPCLWNIYTHTLSLSRPISLQPRPLNFEQDVCAIRTSYGWTDEWMKECKSVCVPGFTLKCVHVCKSFFFRAQVSCPLLRPPLPAHIIFFPKTLTHSLTCFNEKSVLFLPSSFFFSLPSSASLLSPRISQNHCTCVALIYWIL